MLADVVRVERRKLKRVIRAAERYAAEVAGLKLKLDQRYEDAREMPAPSADTKVVRFARPEKSLSKEDCPREIDLAKAGLNAALAELSDPPVLETLCFRY